MNITVQKATVDDVKAISEICSSSWIETYQGIYPENYIQQVIREYYNPERVTKEVLETSKYWNGYWVAKRGNQVLGCIGGGVDDQNAGHVYVFYVRPDIKRQGVGSALLESLTAYQKETYGITEQWITSVTEGNRIGIAFYEKTGFRFQYANEKQENPKLAKSLHYSRKLKGPIE